MLTILVFCFADIDEREQSNEGINDRRYERWRDNVPKREFVPEIQHELSGQYPHPAKCELFRLKEFKVVPVL